MTSVRFLVPSFLFVVLAGCASPRVAEIPAYEADVYPLSQSNAGITIGVDEIGTAERAARYFGSDLMKDGVIPVNIAVSNHGKQAVVIKPSDILLHRGKAVVDPLPIKDVVTSAKNQSLRWKTEKELERFFHDTAFKEAVVFPNQTYRGVLFFAAPAPKTAGHRFLSALGMVREAGPAIRVGVTKRDTGERLLFGPFSLALPEKPEYFARSQD